MDHNAVPIFHRFGGELGRCRAGLGWLCLGRSVRARSVFRTRAECAFDGVYVALEEQQPEWFAVQTVLRTLAAYGGRRCSILSGKAADCIESMVAEERLEDYQEHWGADLEAKYL